jgi:hypothetical protein
VLVRFGRRPKRAILFRTLAPFPKLVANFVVPGGAPGEKVEMLCDGQQVVVDGVHPETGKPYSWFGGAPGEVKHDDLPLIDAQGAQALVNDATRLLVEKFGYCAKLAKPPRGNLGKTYSHIWRSKEYDFPCTPTGVERRDDSDGRIYAWVRTLDGTEHIVPKHELVPAPGGNGAGGDGQADWGITPDVLMDHDNCTALAMRLVKAGMGEGAAVNFLRAQVAGLTNVDEGRRARRLKEIPDMVSSARAKLEQQGAPPPPPPPPPSPRINQPHVTLGDFCAYMPQHNYIFVPTGELWPEASVNSRIAPISVGTNEKGEPRKISANVWLDRTKPVEQMGYPASRR